MQAVPVRFNSEREPDPILDAEYLESARAIHAAFDIAGLYKVLDKMQALGMPHSHANLLMEHARFARTLLLTENNRLYNF